MAERIGKYQVIEQIGRGGMGVIFSARDPILDRSVALKVISSLEVTDDLRARFFREAQACARLSHPNVVTIYDLGEDAGRLFIVMELLQGEQLRQIIARGAPLTIEEKLSVMMQVCDGLHYAHQKGIVHRDIKPANIMRLNNGQVKVLDFGIARIAAGDSDLTQTGLIMGTLRYIAPEQSYGRADYRSDIFSVGAVLYELIGARPPFMGDHPTQLLDQVRTQVPLSLHELDARIPRELAAIADRALRKEPGERFTDLAQMRLMLGQVQRDMRDEAARVRGRVRRQQDELQGLERSSAAHTGAMHQERAIEPLDDESGLLTLQGIEHELAGQIVLAQAHLARVEALEPALEYARQLLESNQLTEAVREFEGIVAEMPQHARAAEGLAQARAGVEQFRQLGPTKAVSSLEDVAIRPAGTTAREDAGGRAGRSIAQPAAADASVRDVPPTDASLGAQARTTPGADTGSGPVAEPRRTRSMAPSSEAKPLRSPVSAVQNADIEEPATDPRETGVRWRLVTSIGIVAAIAIATSLYWLTPAKVARVSVTTPAPSTMPETPQQIPGSPEDSKVPPSATATEPSAALPPPVEEPQLPQRVLPPRSGGGSPANVTVARPRDDTDQARVDADRARTRMAASKRAAERVAAGFHANATFAAARLKEGEGDAAVARSDHAAASRLFQAAQSGYESAVEEAKQNASDRERLAPLQAALEQSRAKVAERRKEALRVEADRLAQAMFNQAQARQVEGDRLLDRKDLSGAARVYIDAAERYEDAIRRAETVREGK